MKVENKYAKRFSEMPTEVEDINNYGFGTGIVLSKKDIAAKSSGGGGCCCCCSGTGSADLEK